jgi:hypothetical protein
MATKNPTEAGAATMMPAMQTAAAAVPASSLTTNMAASSLTAAGNSCLDEQIERLKRCEYLREGEVKALCLRAREILVDESNVQRVDAPVTVRCVIEMSRPSFFGIAVIIFGGCCCCCCAIMMTPRSEAYRCAYSHPWPRLT